MSTTPSNPATPVSPVDDAGDINAPSALPSRFAPEVEADIVDLPAGKELHEADAIELARSKSVKWIVVAGYVECGKTTLLTSLYELFQWGPVAEFEFACSKTLPAFEQRCHLSRSASGASEPKTQRTLNERTVDERPIPTYLHLGLRSAASKRMIDFLFTDVSGEMFEAARDSTDECKELKFLRRAAHFLLLLDSEKAVKVDKRWPMVEEAKTILRSCLDSSMISADCVVTVAWSKFDLFFVNDTAEHKAFRAEVVRHFSDLFGSSLPYLQFREFAARPTKAREMGFGNGVSDLLLSWAKDGLKA